MRTLILPLLCALRDVGAETESARVVWTFPILL
jgi:hypothetical protein